MGFPDEYLECNFPLLHALQNPAFDCPLIALISLCFVPKGQPPLKSEMENPFYFHAMISIFNLYILFESKDLDGF